MRKFLVAAAAVVALVGAASVPSGAEATPAGNITALPSATSVRLGTTLQVRGVATPAGATGRVVLQRHLGTDWVDRDAATVDPATGRYALPITPTVAGTGAFRVRSTGGTLVSATFWVRVWVPTISIVLSAPSAPVGGTAAVAGNALPAGLMDRLVVQRLLGGVWVDRTATIVGAGGAYVFAFRPDRPGPFVVRVRSSAGTVVSPAVTLTVR